MRSMQAIVITSCHLSFHLQDHLLKLPTLAPSSHCGPLSILPFPFKTEGCDARMWALRSGPWWARLAEQWCERWLLDNGLPGKVFLCCSGGNLLFNVGLHAAGRLDGAEMAWVWWYVEITESCLCWRSPCQQLHYDYNIANCASMSWGYVKIL